MEFLVATRPLLAALCLAAALYKLPSAVGRRRRNVAAIALLAGFASEAIGWTLAVREVSQAINRWFQLPSLSTLIMHLLAACVFGPCLLIAVIHWVSAKGNTRRKVRLVLYCAAVVGVLMTVLWRIAAVQSDGSFYLVTNMHRPAVIAYLLAYEVSFGAGLVALIHVCWSYSGRTDDKWLRRSLRLTAIGAVFYLLVSVNRIVSVPTVFFGLDPMDWEVYSGISNRLGELGLVIGLLLPSLRVDVAVVARWVRDLRSYHVLGDLWRDLCQAYPQVSLFTKTRWSAYLQPTEVRFLLNRRIIEIRDAWRALRPYLDTPTGEAQHTERQLAVAAAVQLSDAIHAKAEGAVVDGEPTSSKLERLTVADLDEDIAWLSAVGREYSRIRPARRSGATYTSGAGVSGQAESG
ncbi:MAB_1171c family putative transporter [Actinoplanes sp. NPDC051859]|uniref:MAB_1171c family putative transporter n=1 Tax=Actinoplanes sp. NPDC051859 TaxID=3363909 RepID=UPI0037A644BE